MFKKSSLFALVAMGLAMPANASMPEKDVAEVLTVTVSSKGLDLESADGRQTLIDRAMVAAREACSTIEHVPCKVEVEVYEPTSLRLLRKTHADYLARQ